MKIHLLRHGQTDFNVQGRIQGQRNVPLNSTGRQQIEKFCDSHDGGVSEVYTIILTSPLRRALESAEICSERFGISMILESSFAERRFGIMEGMTKQTIYSRLGIRDVEMLQEGDGVESMVDFRERIRDGMAFIVRQYEQERILIVTHGSVIRLLCEMFPCIQRWPESSESFTPSTEIIPNGHLVEIDFSLPLLRALQLK